MYQLWGLALIEKNCSPSRTWLRQRTFCSLSRTWLSQKTFCSLSGHGSERERSSLSEPRDWVGLDREQFSIQDPYCIRTDETSKNLENFREIAIFSEISYRKSHQDQKFSSLVFYETEKNVTRIYENTRLYETNRESLVWSHKLSCNAQSRKLLKATCLCLAIFS